MNPESAQIHEQVQLHEWSRHYDTMQWTVNGIILAAVGALYLKVLENFSLHLAIFGAVLTLASVFFAASFRHLRKKVQDHMSRISSSEREAADPTWQELLRSSSLLRQWPCNVGLHLLVYGGWLWMLYDKKPDLVCCWILAALFGLGFANYCYTNADTSATRDPR